MASTQQVHQDHRRSRANEQFRRDLLHGLRENPKRIPCKYLYDRRGSQLFDDICELDEYYLTRTELEIMRQCGGAMAHELGRESLVVELGSGSSVKTRILLDHLRDPIAYCPVDISRDHLLHVAGELSRDYPHLEVLPIVADFLHEFELPQPVRKPAAVHVYFPGSTIGNLERQDALQLLQFVEKLCRPHGGLLIGIDLQKDVTVIEAAYNDRQGITDQFNLNLLVRANRELDADFEVDQFRHRAFYDAEQHRVDISLVSETCQTVTIAGEQFKFSAEEAIHTEYSHKYTIESFAILARQAGLSLVKYWTDDRRYFAVLYFCVGEDPLRSTSGTIGG